jgi:hypothetical protein
MSDSHALHPRWLPLLKIEISSNGQNCFKPDGFLKNILIPNVAEKNILILLEEKKII